MRELKFRIWDKQNKTWAENSSSLHCFSNWSICPFTGKLIDYVGAIDGDHGDKYTASPAPDYYMQSGKIVKDSRYVIQQYIGLKDKNGKEIYEGDLIKFYKPLSDHKVWDYLTNGIKKIIYGLTTGEFPDAGYVAISLDRADLEDGVILNHMFQPYMEIIGNILENPELLK